MLAFRELRNSYASLLPKKEVTESQSRILLFIPLKFKHRNSGR